MEYDPFIKSQLASRNQLWGVKTGHVSPRILGNEDFELHRVEKAIPHKKLTLLSLAPTGSAQGRENQQINLTTLESSCIIANSRQEPKRQLKP